MSAPSSAFDTFYRGGKKPADAIRLAIADHRAAAGKMGGSPDFVDSLRIAEAMVEQHPKIVAAAEALLQQCMTNYEDFERGYRTSDLGKYLNALRRAVRS